MTTEEAVRLVQPSLHEGVVVNVLSAEVGMLTTGDENSHRWMLVTHPVVRQPRVNTASMHLVNTRV